MKYRKRHTADWQKLDISVGWWVTVVEVTAAAIVGTPVIN
jgi:hypothetical protein